ncbi:MAG: enoyl-CoA hydratase/isomerase family protein [Elusimicrobiota bacterium]
MTATNKDLLGVTRKDSITILTLERQPSNNLNLALFKALRAAVTECAADKNCHALLITSSIPKYFSAGVDLEEYFSLPEGSRKELFLNLFRLYQELSMLPKPTVAAIGGYALLGGWIVSMACDFRFMAQETGKLALSEIRLGISPTDILIRTLANMAGNQTVVKEMILLGKTVRAEEALQAGLIDGIFPQIKLFEESLAYAKRLSEMAPTAYASIKKSYRERLGGCLDEKTFTKTVTDVAAMLESAEAKEGLSAMRQKRRPVFKRT